MLDPYYLIELIENVSFKNNYNILIPPFGSLLTIEIYLYEFDSKLYIALKFILNNDPLKNLRIKKIDQNKDYVFENSKIDKENLYAYSSLLDNFK
jgi:hypothetical protein